MLFHLLRGGQWMEPDVVHELLSHDKWRLGLYLQLGKLRHNRPRCLIESQLHSPLPKTLWTATRFVEGEIEMRIGASSFLHQNHHLQSQFLLLTKVRSNQGFLDQREIYEPNH